MSVAVKTVSSDHYVLPRDERELYRLVHKAVYLKMADSVSIRLNKQHIFLKLMVYDGRLIFDESVKLSPGSSVLDSGTGSGKSKATINE